ncbi:MAG TPA: Crp/Fnr family transcriptional regulator [Acetobacteraceae bacterium]|nr:Crp/Fnr family transcriptional regulator [Acetobacteraceae bacterium]
MSSMNTAAILGERAVLPPSTFARMPGHVAAPYLRPVPSADIGHAAGPRLHQMFVTHPALRTLSPAERQGLLQGSRVRTLRRKEVAGSEGDPVNHVFLVLDGYIKLSRLVSDGSEVLLDIASPSACIGEFAALQQQPLDVTLTALTPCRLLLMNARHFRQTFERQSDGLRALVSLAGDRLLAMTETLVDICALPAAGRLAKALLRLAPLSSRKAATGGTVSLPVRLSQSEIGMMTGVCREAVNKQLRAWLADGLLDMTAGVVTAIRPAALTEVLEIAT